MKLRNKKTGEIVTLTLSTNGEDVIIMGNDMLAHTTKLSGLKDYEDYEEPTTYYYMSDFGAIREGDVGKFVDDEMLRKEIGNYFETPEEAKKAVEKLKAWKRLKDKGFKFEGWYNGSRIIHFRIDSLDKEGDCSPHFIDDDTANDLDLLFGGEE